MFGDCGGSYCEFVVIQENSGSLQKIPASWDFTEAAALGATLPVSYGALVLRGGLKAGETVLVHSAAGGIGAMATQIAVAMGCRVLGTAGSTEKCAFAESLGASKCINYTQGNWWERVLEETDGRGVDVVFDPVGLVDRSLKCLAHRGRVLVTGFAGLDGQMEKIAMNRVLLKQATLIGYVSSVQTKLQCWKSSNHGLGSDTESLFAEIPMNGGSCGKNFNLSWRAVRFGPRFPTATQALIASLKHSMIYQTVRFRARQ